MTGDINLFVSVCKFREQKQQLILTFWLSLVKVRLRYTVCFGFPEDLLSSTIMIKSTKQKYSQHDLRRLMQEQKSKAAAGQKAPTVGTLHVGSTDFVTG